MPVSFVANRVTLLNTDNDLDGFADAGDILRHTLTFTNTGDTDATAVVVNDVLGGSTETGLMNISPIAFNDAFTAVGNTALRVGGAANIGTGPSSQVVGNLLANDVGSTTVGVGALAGDDVTGFTIQTVTNGVSTQGGTFNIFADGSFSYISQAGDQGTDTFTYTIRDAGIDGTPGNADDTTSTATVTITITGQVWYVDSSAAGGGTGTSANPFNSITALNTANVDGANDYVYVKGSASGALVLEQGEHLIGTGADLDVAGFHLADDGARSTIAGSNAGFTVTLAGAGTGNNEIAGINIVSTGGTLNHALTGTNFGTLTISNATIDASGQGLILATGAIAGTGLVSTDSDGGANNVSLTSITGTLALGSGALSGATGSSFLVSGGTVSTTYTGNITQANNAALLDVQGGHAAGTLTFGTGTLSATNGTGLQFNNADGTYNLNGTNTMNGGDAGIDITNGSGGNFSFSANSSITNPTGIAFNVNGGNGNIDYNGSISHNTNALAISVQNHTGGTVSFDGTVSSTGLSDGIALATNTGGIINFTSTLTLNTSSSNTTAFSATGGGTISATGSGSTINAGQGTGLNVTNTTIGAGDLTFQSISSSGGTATGIILDQTGATGGLHVTGTGGAGTGGTIANKTGADGSNTTGIGIYINGATDVQLADMSLHDFSNFAVRINNVTNLRMNNFAVTGLNGSSNGTVDGTAAGAQNGEDSVRLTNIFGTSSVTNSSISGGFTDSVHIENTSGTQNLLTLDNISVTGRNNASANDALNILATNAGTIMNIAVLNSDFTTGMNKMVNVGAKAGTTINILYDNNTVVQSATLANIVPGGGGVSFNGLGNMNFSILNSSFDFSNGGAGIKSIGLNIFKGGGSTGNFTGVVFNNTVGVSGVNDSGSGPAASALNVDSQGTGSFTLLLRNNSVFHYDEAGIRLNDVDGSSTFNAVVVGNTVSQPEPGAFSGLYVVAGADPGTDGGQITNLQLGGGAGFTNNFSAGDPANAADVFLQNSAGQLRLSQGNSASLSVPTVFANNNPAAGTTFVTTDPGPPAIIVETADFVRLIVSPSTVTEDGVTNITYTFLRWGNTQNALTVNFTVGGSATFNTDYTQSGAATFTASTGTVTFAAGSPVATITINPTTDAGIEANETVVLTLAAGGGYTAATPNSGTATILDDDTAPLLAGSTPPADGGHKGTGDGTGGDQPGPAPDGPTPPSQQPIVVDDGILSQAELNLIVSAAIDRWAAAGVSAADIAAMRAVTFDVADMAGLSLGSSTAGHIVLDSNAAGFSWFIDSTPGEDSEYGGSGSRLTAAPDSQAGVRIDLLTTIMHELGHQIGLSDNYVAGDPDNLMYGLINPGERRLPGADDVANATGAPVGSLAFALSPVSIGTVPAGRTVTIQWDSMVNAFSNQIVPTFNNSSVISWTNPPGSTATSNTEVLGPASAPIALDSLTLGNLIFFDANNNGLFDGGDTGVNGVTLTLFADTNASGTFEAGIDTQLATTTSAGGGLYSFANLAPGDYIVRVDAANFTGGGALLGRVTATGALDPDNNTDNDDNGVNGAGGIVVSQAITLTQNGETTLDGTGQLDINNTLDFGFIDLNEPPVNTVPGTQTINEDATLTFTGGNAISVNDPDVGAGNLTVTLSVNHGVLTLGGTAGLAFGAGDGTDDTTVTFTGTQAAVNNALNGLLYEPNGDFNGSDTLTITTNDNGNTGSDPGTSGGPNDEQDSDTVTINITAVNDAPTVVNGTTETSTAIAEDTPLAAGQSVTTLFGGHYSDAADNQVPNGGASSPGAFSGVAVTANGSSGATGQWQYSTNGGANWQDIGSVTDATARLYNPGTLIRFNPAPDYNGAEPTLTVHLIDNSGPAIVDNSLANLSGVGATGGTTRYSSGTVDLGGTVSAVNDAPVNTVPGTQTIDEDSTVTFSTGNGNAISVNDVDVGGGDLTVTIGMLNGQLTLSGTAGLTFGNGDGTDDTTMTFSGTQAAINAALEGLLYEATLNNNGSDTLTFTVNDQGNSGTDPGLTGDGNSEEDSDTVTININAVNDSPVLTVATPLASTEQVFATIDAAASVSDIDLDALNGGSGDYGGATLTVARQGGANADDLFQFAASGSFTVNGGNLEAGGLVFASFTNSGGTLTVSFNDSGTTATTALVNAVLEAIQYANNNDSPPASIDLDVTLDDGAPANAGQGSVAGHPATDTATVHVNIADTPENQPPVVDLNGAGAGIDDSNLYVENGSASGIGVDIQITDPENDNIVSATVTITDPEAGDLLTVNLPLPPGITVDMVNSTDTTLILIGSATADAYEGALGQVGYSSSSDDPTDQGTNPNRLITVVVNDGTANSAAATMTMSIATINDAPILDLNGAGAGTTTTLAYTENDPVTPISPSATITDDTTDYNDARLIITITNGINAEDVLSVINQGTGPGQVGYSSGVITYEGVPVADLLPTPMAPFPVLDIDFRSGTISRTVVEAVLHAIGYNNTSDDPTVSPPRTVNYQLNDGDGNANGGTFLGSETATINITATNDPPVITGDIAGDVTEAGGVDNGSPGTPTATGDLDAADPDNTADGWQAVAAGGATTGGYGSYALAADGNWTYTLDNNNAAVQALNGAATLIDTFTALTEDGTPQLVTITIHAQDDAPNVRPDAIDTDKANAVSGSVFADNGSGPDVDVDGPAFVVTEVNGVGASVGMQITLPSGALLTLNANGTFDYDPNGAFDATPTPTSGASNQPSQDSFTYTVTGGSVATVTVSIAGLDTNDLLLGTAGADTLVAGTGNDHLAGLAGADNMSGGTGDDVYVVDNAGDLVFEASGEGRDAVYASASYELAGGSEVEILSTISQSATTPLVLIGNGLGQEIYGNAGANFLDGGGGTDYLTGFGGNDSYVVDGSEDVVAEAVGGGTDIVYARASYTLTGGAEVEILSTISLDGTSAIALIGNGFGQTIYGNAGANYLEGGGGADVLIGLGGDDVYFVDGASDYVAEAAGGGRDVVYTTASYTLGAGEEVEVLSTASTAGTTAINLTGNELSNELYGNAGLNVLNGGAGADYMTGFAGADTFQFTTALGGGNIDQINDFLSGTDKIALDDAIFDQLVPGAVNSSLFHVGAAATDEDQRLIYDSATGNLYYDADGTGATAQVLFATLNGHPTLVASDFVVI